MWWPWWGVKEFLAGTAHVTRLRVELARPVKKTYIFYRDPRE
jgi:hypothetical protein